MTRRGWMSDDGTFYYRSGRKTSPEDAAKYALLVKSGVAQPGEVR